MAEAPARAWWDPGWSWKVWAMAAAMAFPTLGFAVWVLLEAGGETGVDEAALALARSNAGGQVIAIQGTEHTIYHALDPLPSASSPRADGRPTLVWFTGPACAACEDLRGINTVMAGYRGRVVFMEKAADRDTAAARYAVGNDPVFLLVDASGEELGRFPLPEDEAAFRAALDALLARTGG